MTYGFCEALRRLLAGEPQTNLMWVSGTYVVYVHAKFTFTNINIDTNMEINSLAEVCGKRVRPYQPTQEDILSLFWSPVMLVGGEPQPEEDPNVLVRFLEKSPSCLKPELVWEAKGLPGNEGLYDVTILTEKLDRVVDVVAFKDGSWCVSEGERVVAWRTRPHPYGGKF